MRLLWVENHAAFARIAGRQFLAAHELIVVPSVAAAKEALSERAFDAVLVDYDLDDGKGVAVVEFVRQLPTRGGDRRVFPRRRERGAARGRGRCRVPQTVVRGD